MAGEAGDCPLLSLGRGSPIYLNGRRGDRNATKDAPESTDEVVMLEVRLST
jgi:hypothetical protein